MSAKPDFWKAAVCGVDNCRSKQYHLENGLTFCKRGHQQEGVETQPDDDFLGTQGRKTRIARTKKEKVSQIARSHDAVLLYLQSYQLILWKQCYALVHTIGLPAELEIVVKDLWALRLQVLKEKVGATSGENTVFSSQPVSEAETEKDEEDVGREWTVRGKAMPTLIETLGLVYFGTVLLRLPISMGDIHRWAIREDIPFIRAIRFVPMVMKQKLPAEYLLALDTTSPLEVDHLRKAIHNLALFNTRHFEVKWPALNVPLLLYRHIRDLALPITLHPITLSISDLLNLDFTFPLPNRQQRVSALPELTLISLLVIATKLYHPFNESTISRHACSLADPAALRLDWSAWVSAQEAHQARLTPEGHLARGSEINVTEKDVMNMTGDQLDEYMDFYERTFIDEKVETKKGGIPKQLLDMFPFGRPDGSTSAPLPYNYKEYMEKEQASINETVKSVVGSLQVRSIATTGSDDDDGNESEPKIGSFYVRYRRAEDLDDQAKFFHEKVAERVGIKLETLLVAVCQMERKLIRYREKEIRDGRARDEDEGAMDTSEDDTDSLSRQSAASIE